MICLNFRCRCFADGANILSAGTFENALRPINIFVFVGVHGDQVVPLFQLLLVALCLNLRNAKTDQAADDAPGRCSDGRRRSAPP